MRIVILAMLTPRPQHILRILVWDRDQNGIRQSRLFLMIRRRFKLMEGWITWPHTN